MFSQVVPPVSTTSDLALDKDAHQHPSLKFVPEIQTPPPEDVAPTQSELKIPSVENSHDAPVGAVDTLTPPPETDSSLSEGFVKTTGAPAGRLPLAILHESAPPQHSPCVVI